MSQQEQPSLRCTLKKMHIALIHTQKFGFRLNNDKAKNAKQMHSWLYLFREKYPFFRYHKDVKYIYVYNERFYFNRSIF